MLEVYTAKKLAKEEKFPNILRRDDEGEIVNRKQMARTNKDVGGEKCTRNDDLAFDDCAQEKAW